MEQEVLIQRYVAETLTKPQMEEVMRRMEVDAVFKAEVDDYILISSGIKVSEKKQLKQRLQAIEHKNDSKGKFFKVWRIAASIALLIGVGFFYVFQSSNSNESLYASNFEPYPNTLQPVVRDTPANPAFIAYEAGNYDTAISEFEMLLQHENDPDIQFYLAMSFLNNGAIHNALDNLKSLETSNTRYLAQVHWYSALAYLKNDNKVLALQSLKALEKLDSTYKIKERKLLENKLD